MKSQESVRKVLTVTCLNVLCAGATHDASSIVVRAMHLGILSSISSRLSMGSLSGRSSRREGAVSVSDDDMLYRGFEWRFFRFSSARRRLWRRKKNIDILRGGESYSHFTQLCKCSTGLLVVDLFIESI